MPETEHNGQEHLSEVGVLGARASTPDGMCGQGADP
jgi:hypothetical protein